MESEAVCKLSCHHPIFRWEMVEGEWKIVTKFRKPFSKPLWSLQEAVNYGQGVKEAEIKLFYLSLILTDMDGECYGGTSHLLLLQEWF